MAWRRRKGSDRGPGFIGRLRRDIAGNTLAIMAAMMLPMIALAGSAVDTARLYVVKVRLQQACDAGVLAGHKTMDISQSAPAPPTLDAKAVTQAEAFFANNFISGYMGTPAFTAMTKPYPFVPTKTSDYQVAGTATVAVPMTLMKIFGQPTQTITVTCQARYDVADTDVVFVLDTTGSMSCLPSDNDSTCDSYVSGAGTTKYNHPADSSLNAANGSTGSANDSVAGYPGSTGYYVPEKSGSRIAAVRQAVAGFYTFLTPPNIDTTTHIRYGFVTYSSTVNAGKAIMAASPSYMLGGAGSNGASTWTYQSRFIDPAQNSQYQISQSSAYDNTTKANCAGSARTPAATGSQPYTFNTSSQATVVSKAWDNGQNKCNVTTTVYGPLWTYGPTPFNVSSFLTNASVDDPSKVDSTTNSWQGCIEERATTAGVSSFSNSSLPPDLDPDLIPTSDASRWKPMWPETIYWRNYGTLGNGWFGNTTNVMSSYGGDSDPTAYYQNNNVPNAFSIFYYGSGSNANYFLKAGLAPCGKPIRRVSTMTQQDVTNYVNATDFVPQGGTYHDAGMIWGTRLLSTAGVFAGDVGAWPGRQPTNKIIVFLTDGSMSPSLTSYGLYGLEYFDKRVTGGDYAPPAAANPNTQQTAYHNARFLAECAKAKSMNINIYTVMITTNITSTPQLQQCATTTAQALVSSSGSDLNAKFQAIAQQVAMLRISQ